MKKLILESELKKNNVPFKAIEDEGAGFFTIYYNGSTLENSNHFFKKINKIENLYNCGRENGYNEKGSWQRFKFYN